MRSDGGDQPVMRGRFGEFRFDSATRELVRGEQALHISPKAIDLLQSLIEARPRALSRQEILDVGPSTLDLNWGDRHWE